MSSEPSGLVSLRAPISLAGTASRSGTRWAQAKGALLPIAMLALSCASDAPQQPQIDSLVPQRVPHGQEIEATVSGHNFRTQPLVAIDSQKSPTVNRAFDVWLGSNALPTGTVSCVDQATLTIVIPKTLAVGLYDLTIRSPAGRWARLPSALTVFDSGVNSSGGASSSNTTASSVSSAGASNLSSNSTGGGGTIGGNGNGGETSFTDAGTFPTSAGGLSAIGSGGTSYGGLSAGGFGGTFPASYGGLSAVGSGGSSLAGSGGLSSIGGFASTVLGTGGVGGGQTNSSATGGDDSGTTEPHYTLWTDGRVLRDACGNAILLRGVQQILAEQIPAGNDWTGLIDQIAGTGANAIRIQVETATLGITGVDAVLTRLGRHGMVAILNPDDTAWLAEPAVVSMLTKHQDHLILDAYGPGYDNRTKFLSSATAAVVRLRGYGYQVPFIVLSNNYGRDLPTALDYGAQIVAGDPLHNTILGWEAYWGSSGWYQNLYGMSLAEGIAASARVAFPIQVGLTLIADPPSDYLDYKTAMTETQANSLGWLWWDWYNPSGRDNNLSVDGTSANLLSVGEYVVHTQTVGIEFASMPTCSLH